jgi:hypothetical protein
LYRENDNSGVDTVVPWVTADTVFQITQFTLSSDEYSPDYFTAFASRKLMGLGTTQLKGLFGCTLLDFIRHFKDVEKFKSSSYSVHICNETTATPFLTTKGLQALVDWLEGIHKPYRLDTQSTAAEKDDIDLAAEVPPPTPVVKKPAAVAAAASATTVDTKHIPTPNPVVAVAPTAPAAVVTTPTKAKRKTAEPVDLTADTPVVVNKRVRLVEAKAAAVVVPAAVVIDDDEEESLLIPPPAPVAPTIATPAAVVVSTTTAKASVPIMVESQSQEDDGPW